MGDGTNGDGDGRPALNDAGAGRQDGTVARKPERRRVVIRLVAARSLNVRTGGRAVRENKTRWGEEQFGR
jgi:hypothetical protein